MKKGPVRIIVASVAALGAVAAATVTSLSGCIKHDTADSPSPGPTPIKEVPPPQVSPTPPSAKQKLFTGRITNKKTKLPVGNADVTLTGTGVPILRTTDDNGVFTAPLEDLANGLIISVTVDGYVPATITVTPSDRTEPIALTPVAPAPIIPTPKPSVQQTIDPTPPVKPSLKTKSSYIAILHELVNARNSGNSSRIRAALEKQGKFQVMIGAWIMANPRQSAPTLDSLVRAQDIVDKGSYSGDDANVRFILDNIKNKKLEADDLKAYFDDVALSTRGFKYDL